MRDIPSLASLEDLPAEYKLLGAVILVSLRDVHSKNERMKREALAFLWMVAPCVAARYGLERIG